VEEGETQIVPLVIGDSRQTMEVCERALERGVFAQAIRPPTVPEGTARLRLAAMANHTPAELRWAARQLAAATRECGLEPAGTNTDPEADSLDGPALRKAA
jgi:glycine C-acetyltransferase/8-amino-7-oxononanoate synthase